jgi:hypothetical protein
VVHDLPVGLGELQREDRCDGLGPRVLQEEADAVVGAANNTRNTDTAVSGRWHTRAVHVMTQAVGMHDSRCLAARVYPEAPLLALHGERVALHQTKLELS